MDSEVPLLDEKFSPRGLQRLQEQTPKDKPPAEGTLRRSMRITLERLSSAQVVEHVQDSQRRGPQKRLLEKYSRNGESPRKEMKVGNRQKSRPLRDTSDVSASESEASEEDSDVEAFPPSPAPLSAYERKRLQNIKQNAQFFATLNILESAATLKNKKKPQAKPKIKRFQPKAKEEEKVQRRSMRLQRVDPSGVPLPELAVQWNPLSENDNPVKPAGPLDMTPVNDNDDPAVVREFLNKWKEASEKVPSQGVKQPPGDLKGYKTRLQGMWLKEEHVSKVVKNRIFSVAVHPSETRTLVAAGDKWGQVGLWDLDAQSNEVFVFEPHSRPVGCLHFSPANPAHVFSASYDGSLRCGDLTKGLFDEVYRDEGSSFSSFDFLSDDCCSLIVAHWEAEIAVVDRRTPGTSSELLGQVNSKTIRTVHVHPVDRNYILTAGAGDVSIYDARCLKRKGMRPMASLKGHTKSVGSAYFSPVTGNRVVTICADDRIRLYDTSSLHSEAYPCLLSLRHNNNTGRWLTRFRPVWDPKRDDCFMVGSMQRPRQIEVFHESGDLVHAFVDEDFLGSVCSINAMHPTRDVLVGGNSSGRLHVFRD